MITSEQANFFWQHGYLHITKVFTDDEIDQMANDLDWLIETWAHKTPGWSGPWRKDYMDEETEKQSNLIAMHDLYFYSESWMKAVTNSGLFSVRKLLVKKLSCYEIFTAREVFLLVEEIKNVFSLSRDRYE